MNKDWAVHTEGQKHKETSAAAVNSVSVPYFIHCLGTVVTQADNQEQTDHSQL